MLDRIRTPLATCNLKFQQTSTINAENIGVFSGYASVFGGIDSDRDTIMKGAFADVVEAIKNGEQRMPLMLHGHWQQDVIGKWTLIQEDDIGLYVEGEFTPNHSMASDVYSSMKHGAVDGMSIGFILSQDGYEELENGGRRISKIAKLPEISVVSFPADDAARTTTVKMTESIESIKSIRDAEQFLREAGKLSRSMAKAFISQCRPLYQREADAEIARKEAYQADLEWLDKLITR